MYSYFSFACYFITIVLLFSNIAKLLYKHMCVQKSFYTECVQYHFVTIMFITKTPEYSIWNYCTVIFCSWLCVKTELLSKVLNTAVIFLLFVVFRQLVRQRTFIKVNFFVCTQKYILITENPVQLEELSDLKTTILRCIITSVVKNSQKSSEYNVIVYW